MNCHFHAPMPDNVPACSMAPGMKEREELKKELARQSFIPKNAYRWQRRTTIQ